ncbi:cysteine hydrolase family protein [Amphritea sp. HPY]|uniref:cysteine hydrolase family protein n=1 Tax=Amphritea sp. HPY TaxID=3421652 RepID=UPI003D7C4CDB
MFETANQALIIVDVQKAIDCYSQKQRNNPNAESVIASLLSRWRHRGLPVIHVRHSSKFESSPYHASSEFFGFKDLVSPAAGELVVTKAENSAFIGTTLQQELVARGVTEIIVCGVLTNNSIDATVRVAAGLGYKVFVPQDATAAFELDLLNGKQVVADDVHWMFLSNLHEEYCTVCTAGQLLNSAIKGD